MKHRLAVPLSTVLILGALYGVGASDADDALRPAKMSREDISGKMFDSPDVTRTQRNGDTILDVTSLMSSDKKFASGMYKAGKSRFEVNEPYGADEFMYFLDGGVTLTSADGHRTVIGVGEAVTIPKEWTGIWETDGYTKIWVIYSDDGSGLE